LNPKSIFYINLLGICMTVGATCAMISKLILDVPIKPHVPVLIAFCWVMVIKFNPVFHELLEKYKNK
jgi:hypothetical protein